MSGTPGVSGLAGIKLQVQCISTNILQFIHKFKSYRKDLWQQRKRLFEVVLIHPDYLKP